MTIAQRELEILRVKKASGYSKLNEELNQQIQTEVVSTVQTILEESLKAEVSAHLAELPEEKPRRSGYYQRTLNTQYGQIADLAVPKLRRENRQREWQILNRYSRCLTGLLDYAGYLYVMGLSLRDLQEALYLLMGMVLSTSAINQVTLRVEKRMHKYRQARIAQTPAILIVDGVWVTIQYTLEELKTDKAGHERHCRKAEDRVILAAMAVWPDGSHHLLHYKVSEQEDTASWSAFFQEMIARGLDPQAVDLVVSDGSTGLLEAMAQCLPQAVQQRCITHKVRGMEPRLSFVQLPEKTENGDVLTKSQAKDLRRTQITQDAYAIYDAPSLPEALLKLDAFNEKWQPIEPEAVHTFNWAIKRTFEFYSLDPELHLLTRTTNLLERFFREFRNKADEIGAFPNENSCLTLFFLVMQREHAKHGRLPVANTS
jgi:transposase-like protein